MKKIDQVFIDFIVKHLNFVWEQEKNFSVELIKETCETDKETYEFLSEAIENYLGPAVTLFNHKYAKDSMTEARAYRLRTQYIPKILAKLDIQPSEDEGLKRQLEEANYQFSKPYHS